MAKQPETIFKEKIFKDFDEIPKLFYFKLQLFSKKGLPDVFICYCGRFLVWELKVNNNKTTPIQNYFLKKIENAGGIARIVTPVNYKKYLKELLDLSK